MWTTAKTLVLCAILTLAVQPLPAQFRSPSLITKGKGFFLHAIPGVESRGLFPFGSSFGNGMGIYRTDTTTGEMWQVLASGVTATIIPMGIDRIDYSRTIIAGVTTDAERLYVLQAVWSKSARRFATEIPPPGEFPGKPRYRLWVYSLPDLKAGQHHELKEGDLPEDAPTRDNAEAGPLAVKENGVSCYGVTFTFKGMDLLEQRYEKKP